MAERVFLARVEAYGEGPVREAVARALDALGVRLPGTRWVAKANWVFAHPRAARWAYTDPGFLVPAVAELLERRPGARLVFVGNSGAGVATRAVALRGGARALLRRFGGRVALEPTDEGPLLRYRLRRGRPLAGEERRDPAARPPEEARFWSEITTSAILREADAVVYFPKLKSNVLSGGLSGALKLGGIGLLVDRDRMTGHNRHNDRRIADMLDVVVPDLVVTDAVRIGWGGNQMTQPGAALGAVVVATNPVAHDAVCARILGLDPRAVEHLRLAAARGYGPLDAGEIEVLGDWSVGELARRVAGLGPSPLVPVDGFGERFRERTGTELPLEVVSGPPVEGAGCHGLLLDWLYMSFDHPGSRRRMARWPRASVFVGAVGRPPRHRTVYLVGDRAREAFWRVARPGWGLRVPEGLRRRLGGFGAVRRGGGGGGGGGAVEIPGDPPTHRDLILAFFLGSGGRMRAPLLTVRGVVDAYVRTVPQGLRSWWRNRGGIRVVEAPAHHPGTRRAPVGGAA